MSKFFHTGRHDNDPDTVPSQLSELSLRHRLERREEYRDGWRRNLTIAALLVIACMLAGYFLH